MPIMKNTLKQKKQFPIPVYLIVSFYLLLAIGFNYWFFSQFTIRTVTTEMFVATSIIMITSIKPIVYKGKNTIIRLNFQLPILFIFGLAPVLFVRFIKLFLPSNEEKELPAIKNYFNYSNSVISFTFTSILFQFLVNNVPEVQYKIVFIVIVSSLLFVILQTGSVALIVYYEKRYNVFKHQYHYIFNIFSSNLTNGIITYYLYQSLGILGLFVSVIYAILFSKRSQYQAAYDKKRIELNEIEHRAKMVFDTIDYGIIVLDHEHRIILANPVAQKTLYSFDPEPIGKIVEELDPDYSKEIFEIIHWSFLNKEKFEQKSVRSTVLGETRYYDIHTYPQISSEGEMVGLIWIYKNVTEEHLIRRQLVEADKLTRLGQIAAGKVHEIKNPLTTVRGYLQFLKQKVAKGEPIKLNSFDIALQEIDRTNELINSLLILSKHTNDLQDVILLDSLVEEVIQLFQHQFTLKNISFHLENEKNVCVIGVENHLKQILINLFLNAIDALKENKENPQIKMRIIQEEKHVIMEFLDNGVGISEGNLTKLHQPFFSTKVNGTGLGLSVTYKLIEEHGGTIKVSSKVGLGTTFLIQLPRVESDIKGNAAENLVYV